MWCLSPIVGRKYCSMLFESIGTDERSRHIKLKQTEKIAHSHRIHYSICFGQSTENYVPPHQMAIYISQFLSLSPSLPASSSTRLCHLIELQPETSKKRTIGNVL